MYCEVGEKATITYKFNNEQEKRYQSSNSPVKIEVKQGILEDFTGGQCPEWYGIIYRTTGFPTYGSIAKSNHVGQGVLGPITFIRKRLVSRYGDDNYVFDKVWQFDIGCRGGDDIYYADGVAYLFINYAVYGEAFFLGFERYNPSGGNTLLEDNCGNPKPNCDLTITYNDQVIFTDRGNCPCTFTVQCGDCPEGTVRCNSPGYPGYCCIPCAELTQRINAMTRRL